MFLDDIDKIRDFFSVFQGESDRAKAVLAASLLDAGLTKLLKAGMKEGDFDDLFGGYAPLSNFSGKIDLACAFGLISDEDRNDLHVVRKIRNLFAHELDHELSFATQKIRDRVATMQLPKILYDHPTLHVDIDTPSARFEMGVGILHYLLTEIRSTDVARARPPRALTDIVAERGPAPEEQGEKDSI